MIAMVTAALQLTQLSVLAARGKNAIFDVTAFGARGDGASVDSAAVRKVRGRPPSPAPAPGRRRSPGPQTLIAVRLSQCWRL